MDAGYVDEYGYIYVTARDDDVINVAGHRLSTSALEDVVLSHPDVVDTAVVGAPEPNKGEIPLCLYVMKDGNFNLKAKRFFSLYNETFFFFFVSFVADTQKTEEQINQELIAKVRQLIGPIAAFKLAAAVKGLPRTRSGKTVRKSIAELARSRAVKVKIFLFIFNTF